MARGGGDGQHAVGAVRKFAAKLSACIPPIEPPTTAWSRLDPERIEQRDLRAHHVADGDHRKAHA